MFQQAIKFALACWDCVRGNEVCACYPSYSIKDKGFLNRVLSHSIWYLGDSMGDEFRDERIDVEFQGYVLSAFFLDVSDSPEKETFSKRFLLFIESPIDQSLVVDQIYPILKRRLTEELGESLIAVLEKSRLVSSKIKHSSYQQKIQKGREVEEKLVKIWEEVIKGNLKDHIRTLEVTGQYLDTNAIQSEAPLEKKTNELVITKRPTLIQRTRFFTPDIVDISIVIPVEGDNCQVIIKNALKDLDNVTIGVSHVRDIFSETVFSEAIGTFHLMEQLALEIPREKEAQSYIVEIRSNKKKVTIKKIDVPAVGTV